MGEQKRKSHVPTFKLSLEMVCKVVVKTSATCRLMGFLVPGKIGVRAPNLNCHYFEDTSRVAQKEISAFVDQ